MNAPVKPFYNVDILLPSHWKKRALYRLTQDEDICGYVVPLGYITDGATVPKPFLWLFPAVCQYFPAALLHDYLLDNGYSWRFANNQFRDALRWCGIPRWRRYCMSASVGIYGFYKTAIKTLRG